VVVYLPAGYTDPKQAERRYPVIETFSGYPGRPEQWLDSMALGEVLDEQVALARMAPTIVIAPELEIPPGRDTECVDGGTAGPAMETWLTTDVPNWAVGTLRVRLDRASWDAAGLSAGGWCAAMAALLHPARYGSAMIFGGYFHPYFSKTYMPFGPGSPQWRHYDLVALVKRSPPPVAIWMETSHSDATSYRSSAAFLAASRAPLSVRVVEYAHAGHSILLWAPLVPQAVEWLETIGGFRA
jgi:enterochelin esterase-like enzyme